MHFDLPDLKLVPQPEWKARRREWIALAEDCLYGHAPAYTPVRAEVLKQESLWAGLARCFPQEEFSGKPVSGEWSNHPFDISH